MHLRASFFILSLSFYLLPGMAQNSQIATTLSGQPETMFNMTRMIELDKDSEKEEIIIDVKENTQKFRLSINSGIENGTLTIELYDPKNVKKGNFTIGTQLKSSKRETVNGDINKSIKEPEVGQWKVMIIPKNVSGAIQIKTSFIE